MLVARCQTLILAFLSILMIAISPILESKLSLNQSISGEIFSAKSLSKGPHNHTRNEASKEEADDYEETTEKGEQEFEVIIISKNENKGYFKIYSMKRLDQIKKFTQDGFVSKLFKPPSFNS